MDLAALRIDAFEYALDRAVLAGCVHALKDQQQRPAILGIKFFLKIAQPLPVGFDDLLGLHLVETAPVIGLVRFEVEFARSVDAEGGNERLQLGAKRLRRLLAHHVGSSGWLLGAAKYMAWGGCARRRAHLLLCKLRLQKRGDKSRHRRGEIAALTHEMDRAQFRLKLLGEIGLDPD